MHAYRRRPRVGGRAGGDAAQAAADPKRVTQAACRLRSLLQPRPASPDAPLPSAQSKTATESEFQMERGAPARRAPARAWRRRPMLFLDDAAALAAFAASLPPWCSVDAFTTLHAGFDFR